MSKERPQPGEEFGFTEQEARDERITDKRFRELLADERTAVHQIEVSTNNYGEYLFVTMSRPAAEARSFVTFWSLGFHEQRERWLTDEWRYYDTNQMLHQIPQKISPEDALALVQARRDEISPQIAEHTQSRRAQLFELLAGLTDEDGAYTELEDMEDLGFFDEDAP